MEFDNDVQLFFGNLYYDFDEMSGIQPYVGVGVGAADIEYAEDVELVISGHAGINFALSENAYVGAKVSLHHISGPDGEIGLEFDDVVMWTGMVVLGARF